MIDDSTPWKAVTFDDEYFIWFKSLDYLIRYYDHLMHGENCLIKLIGCYSLTARYFEWYHYERTPVCSPSCGFCCYQPVELTLLEAELISEVFEILPNMYLYSSKAKVKHTPCPFLDSNNNCIVYEYRPFVCRLTFAYESNEKCKYGIEQCYHDFSAVMISTYSGDCHHPLEGILEYIYHLNDGNTTPCEIRQVFSKW